MYSLQTLHINMSYVFSSNSSYKHVLCILFKLLIHRTCLYEEVVEHTYDICIWRVWREYIRHVYMKSLKRIHKTCDMKSLRRIHKTCYVFSSNSSYKHVLCILFKLFIKTCPMYALQTLHINMSYIRHVYMKSLKRIHRTCIYEEFEEST
jgi:ABC-type iron transport system FetAB permease component